MSIQEMLRIEDIEEKIFQLSVKLTELTKRVDRIMEVVSGVNTKEDWK